MPMNTAVYGLLKDRSGLEAAVAALRQGGFQNKDISMLLPSAESGRGARDRAEGRLAKNGILDIPGIGLLVAAGPIAALLTVGNSGGIVKSLESALLRMGFPGYEARRFEDRIKKGQILLSIDCDTSERVERARYLLTNAGVSDVAASSQPPADFMGTEESIFRTTKEKERV